MADPEITEWWISKKQTNVHGVVEAWLLTENACGPYSPGPYPSKEKAETVMAQMKDHPNCECKDAELFVHRGRIPIRAPEETAPAL